MVRCCGLQHGYFGEQPTWQMTAPAEALLRLEVSSSSARSVDWGGRGGGKCVLCRFCFSRLCSWSFKGGWHRDRNYACHDSCSQRIVLDGTCEPASRPFSYLHMRPFTSLHSMQRMMPASLEHESRHSKRTVYPCLGF